MLNYQLFLLDEITQISVHTFRICPDIRMYRPERHAGRNSAEVRIASFLYSLLQEPVYISALDWNCFSIRGNVNFHRSPKSVANQTRGKERLRCSILLYLQPAESAVYLREQSLFF